MANRRDSTGRRSTRSPQQQAPAATATAYIGSPSYREYGNQLAVDVPGNGLDRIALKHCVQFRLLMLKSGGRAAGQATLAWGDGYCSEAETEEEDGEEVGASKSDFRRPGPGRFRPQRSASTATFNATSTTEDDDDDRPERIDATAKALFGAGSGLLRRAHRQGADEEPLPPPPSYYDPSSDRSVRLDGAGRTHSRRQNTHSDNSASLSATSLPPSSSFRTAEEHRREITSRYRREAVAAMARVAVEDTAVTTGGFFGDERTLRRKGRSPRSTTIGQSPEGRRRREQDPVLSNRDRYSAEKQYRKSRVGPGAYEAV